MRTKLFRKKCIKMAIKTFQSAGFFFRVGHVWANILYFYFGVIQQFYNYAVVHYIFMENDLAEENKKNTDIPHIHLNLQTFFKHVHVKCI